MVLFSEPFFILKPTTFMPFLFFYLFVLTGFSQITLAQSPIINPSNQVNQLLNTTSTNFNQENDGNNPFIIQEINSQNINTSNTSQIEKPKNIELNRELFIKQPQILEHLMVQAMNNNQVELLEFFIEDYKFLKPQQQNIIFFNQAKWYHAQYLSSKNHWKKAQMLCDEIETSFVYQPNEKEIQQFNSEQRNDFTKNFSAFQEQFIIQQLQLTKSCEQMNQWIDQQKMWQLSLGGNFVSDKNINNASSNPTIRFGNTVFYKDNNSLPQKDQGIAYFGNLHKITPLSDIGFDGIDEEHRTVITGFLNGRVYQKLNQFNDHQHRIGVGYQFDNGQKQVNFYPFFGQRYFDNRVFTNEKGIHLDYQHRFTGFLDENKTQPNYKSITVGGEFAEHDYVTRSFLNNHSRFVFAQYQQKLNTHLFGFTGIDFYREKPIALWDRYNRIGIRLGFVYDVPYQYSIFNQAINPTIRLQSNVATRRHEVLDPLFNEQRKDIEQFHQISLWNRAWQLKSPFLGTFTPKINFTYQNNKSKIDTFSFQKNNLFISLEQVF
jgi:hypothetical protein